MKGVRARAGQRRPAFLISVCCLWTLYSLLICSHNTFSVTAQQIETYNGSIIWSIPGAKMMLMSDAGTDTLAGVNSTTFATQSALDTALGGIQGQFGGIQGQLTTTSTRINGIDTVNNGLQAQVTHKFKPIYCPPR